jgi:uncharacterized protein YndB with AHSA1/START domain
MRKWEPDGNGNYSQERLKVLEIIIIAIIALVGVVLIYAGSRPDTLHVARAEFIDAPPERIFPYLNDFRRWPQWSPWEKLDENMQREYSGPESGVGATYAWDSKKAGVGKMEILKSEAPDHLFIDLKFEKPMQAHNEVEFVLNPEGGRTLVTWSMIGPQPYLAKLMSVFMNTHKRIGHDFDAGLRNLKAVVERGATA